MKDLRLTAEKLLDEGVCVRRPTEEVLGWDSIVNLSYGQTYARVTYLERVDFVPASSWAKDLVAVEFSALRVKRVLLEDGRVHVRSED